MSDERGSPPPRAKRVRFTETVTIVSIPAEIQPAPAAEDDGARRVERRCLRRALMRLHFACAHRRLARHSAPLRRLAPLVLAAALQQAAMPPQPHARACAARAMPRAHSSSSTLAPSPPDAGAAAAPPEAAHAAVGRGLREAEDKSVMEDVEAAEEDYDSPEEVGGEAGSDLGAFDLKGSCRRHAAPVQLAARAASRAYVNADSVDVLCVVTHPLPQEFNDAGIPIEPFHLKREREEGYFDAEVRRSAGPPGVCVHSTCAKQCY